MYRDIRVKGRGNVCVREALQGDKVALALRLFRGYPAEC